jgi:hypothetical protein
LGSILAWSLASVNVSGCSDSLVSGCANPGPAWREQTRQGKRNIKKLRDLAQDETVDLWALDEVHFQLHGSRCRMWIPPDTKDPVTVHNPTRESVGYFGAVRIRDGKFVYQREEKVFSEDSFFTFLKQLRQISSHAKRRVVLILDNLRYHHASLHKSWRQQCNHKFILEFMPPYSPKLNPIERL